MDGPPGTWRDVSGIVRAQAASTRGTAAKMSMVSVRPIHPMSTPERSGAMSPAPPPPVSASDSRNPCWSGG